MDAIMTTAREFTYLEAGLRILMAIVLGGMIGMERGLKNRPAGLRTYMLVCLGACIVMLTNQYVYEAFGVGDPVRMGAQVVSGIGFLGAGTISVTARNQIKILLIPRDTITPIMKTDISWSDKNGTELGMDLVHCP